MSSAPSVVATTSSNSREQQPLQQLLNGAIETRSRTAHKTDEHLLGKANEAEVSHSGTIAYNMVAAMNEHLSSSPLTNNVRSATSRDKIKEHSKDKDKSDIVDEDSGKGVGTLGYPCDFDHMYASMTDGGGAPASVTAPKDASPLRGNEARQADQSEVKHLKELLLLHLDLIQQQSEQIVTKDKLLSALRQENETLKLRLERMDRRVNLQKHRSDNGDSQEHGGPCSPPSLHAPANSLPSTSDHHKNTPTETHNPQHSESFKIRLNTSGGITTVKQELVDKYECKPESMEESWENKKKRKSDPHYPHNGSKRRRGVSSSSTVSNDTSSTLHETIGGKGPSLESLKKVEKKTKSFLKKESFLTTEEHYYTAVGDPDFVLCLSDRSSEESSSGNLEVPNWRVKVYTSCYTMEGTENLDDEIFNKRHLKLENDERRRKRWDVQRIREQRHIEKLKQRQERQNHHASCLNVNHTGPCSASTEEENITTLWPDVDQIQSIQVDTLLPVSSFGASIPSFISSDFCMPWLLNMKSKTRRMNNKKKKSSRR